MTEPTPDDAPTGDKSALCGASSRIGFHYLVPHIGPCVLRHDHDGPVHQDADGTQWTDPNPPQPEDPAELCPPTGTYRITVQVPAHLPDEQLAALYTAVADAAHDWEPDDRDGWDIDVTGTTHTGACHGNASAAVTEATDALRRAAALLTAAETQLRESTTACAEHGKAITDLAAERDEARKRAEEAEAAVELARRAAEDLRAHVGPSHIVTPYVLRILRALDADQPKENREEAEATPGTYWERAVLERFAMGGPVDLLTVRRQVAALLAETPRRDFARDNEEVQG